MEKRDLEKSTAILSLAKRLEADGIPHVRFPRLGGYQVCYPTASIPERVCSVIWHVSSYGYGAGLLEIMGLLTDEERADDSVAGYLEEDDVYQRIKKHWEGLENEST